MNDTDADSGRFSRRSVLRTGAVVAGTVVVGGAAAAGADADAAAAASDKRGGRAQLDGDARRNEPFTLTMEGTSVRSASCNSAESATQTYIEYSIQYCDADDDESDGTLYILPDEAELAPQEVYEIRAIQPCRASDLQMVAMGPSNQSCE